MSETRQLSHIDESGRARMVDVTDKDITTRVAMAEARVRMRAETLELIREGGHAKGDVFGVARIAGIQAAKKCADLIPLCHPLSLGLVTVDFDIDAGDHAVIIRASCKTDGKTGVEMEALTAASVAGLTIYDMCKAVDRGMVIESVRLISKEGGKSGAWHAEHGA